jgi:predicted Zn finger-like uncharacterized protein
MADVRELALPLYRCPNCHAKIRVGDHQLGKVLVCSKCGGRFLADPGLPPDVFVQNYAGEAPPVQPGEPDPDPPMPPRSAPPPRTAAGESGHVRWEDGREPAGDSAGWVWFAVLLALEVAAGVLWAEIRSRAILDFGLIIYISVFLDDTTRRMVYTLRAVLLAHEVCTMVALFWAASHARRNGTSIAHWMLPILLLQSFGLAIYLVGRPRPGGENAS